MRNTPVELVVLRIAEHLQTLVKNPDLSKKIKDAYALADTEQAKLDKAVQTMAKSDQLLADIKKREDALAVIDDRIKKSEELEKINNEQLKAIGSAQREIEKKIAETNDFAAKTDARSKKLAESELTLAKREAVLKQEEESIASRKAELNKLTEIVKGQVGAL